MADALNRRLHDTLTVDGPTAQAARDQTIRIGDLIISRHNNARIPVHAAPGADREPDQVRNGNRWRVAGIDETTNRIAAERLTDKARVVFESDYLREHVHLGYAVTVHTAQGVTADTAHAVIAEFASRAMAYVAMSRGRDTNHAYIYTHFSGEADHEHTTPVADVHMLRRGTKYAAAHYFRMILANDERPRTMHAEAERTERELLPDNRQPAARLATAPAAPHAIRPGANTPPPNARSTSATNASPPTSDAPPTAPWTAATDSNCRSPPRHLR